MPLRTATLSKQIKKNGARLHLAMLSRTHARGADHAPSEAEQALLEERRSLKDSAAQRQAAALLPKAKPVKEVKAAKPAKAPKAPKAPKPASEAKPEKAAKTNKPSRAVKLAKKAENAEAAKKATQKSAKT